MGEYFGIQIMRKAIFKTDEKSFFSELVRPRNAGPVRVHEKVGVRRSAVSEIPRRLHALHSKARGRRQAI